MKPFLKLFLIVCLVGAGAGVYWWKTQPAAKIVEGAPGKSAKAEAKKREGRRGGGPISVTTVTVAAQAMPVVIDVVGTVESEHSVAVRPQVGGLLEAVLFKEGDRVKQGQPLFRIDSRPMRAALDQTRAALARDQAQLTQAQAQEARLRPLMEKDYITKNEYDVAATQATEQPLGSDVPIHYLRTTNPFNPENLAVYPKRLQTNRPNPYRFPNGFDQLATGLPVYEDRQCIASNTLPSITNVPIDVTNTVTSTVSDATGGLVTLPPIPQVPLSPAQAQALIPDSLLQQIQHFAFGDGAAPSALAPACKKQGPFDFNGTKSQYPHVNALK